MLTSKSTLMCMITRYPFHKLIEVVAHLQKGIVVFQAIILQYSSVAKSPKSPNVIMHNTKKPSPATMMPIFLRIV